MLSSESPVWVLPSFFWELSWENRKPDTREPKERDMRDMLLPGYYYERVLSEHREFSSFFFCLSLILLGWDRRETSCCCCYYIRTCPHTHHPFTRIMHIHIHAMKDREESILEREKHEPSWDNIERYTYMCYMHKRENRQRQRDETNSEMNTHVLSSKYTENVKHVCWRGLYLLCFHDTRAFVYAHWCFLSLQLTETESHMRKRVESLPPTHIYIHTYIHATYRAYFLPSLIVFQLSTKEVAAMIQKRDILRTGALKAETLMENIINRRECRYLWRAIETSLGWRAAKEKLFFSSSWIYIY